MSKTPRERLSRYICPFLSFDVTAGKGKATPITFLIDTGGITRFALEYIEKQGLKTKKKASSGLY